MPQITDLVLEKGTLFKFDLQLFPLQTTRDHLQSLQTEEENTIMSGAWLKPHTRSKIINQQAPARESRLSSM